MNNICNRKPNISLEMHFERNPKTMWHFCAQCIFIFGISVGRHFECEFNSACKWVNSDVSRWKKKVKKKTKKKEKPPTHIQTRKGFPTWAIASTWEAVFCSLLDGFSHSFPRIFPAISIDAKLGCKWSRLSANPCKDMPSIVPCTYIYIYTYMYIYIYTYLYIFIEIYVHT